MIIANIANQLLLLHYVGIEFLIIYVEPPCKLFFLEEHGITSQSNIVGVICSNTIFTIYVTDLIVNNTLFPV